MSAFIETFTGARLCPLAPDPETIWVEDIAHHLSNQCRFSGATSTHYSVAEHSVRVSWLLGEWGEDEGVQFAGLMHDSPEYALVDLPTPLKESPELAEAYATAERRLWRAICDRFKMPEKLPEIVKVADVVLLATEVRDLMPGRKEHWGKLVVKPMDQKIHPWHPGIAEWEFLHRFRDLDGRR